MQGPLVLPILKLAQQKKKKKKKKRIVNYTENKGGEVSEKKIPKGNDS